MSPETAARLARSAEGRRAGDGPARRDHGGEADRRADPALPPAAALPRRRASSRSRRPASRSRRSAETTAQTGVEMEALTAAVGRRADRLRHGQGGRQGDGRRGRAAAREDEGGRRVRAAVLTVSDGVSAASARIGAATCSSSCSPAEGYEVERRGRAGRARRDRRRDPRARRRGAASCSRPAVPGSRPRDVTPEATRDVLDASGAGDRRGPARRLDRQDAARSALPRARPASSARRSSSTCRARRAVAATASRCCGRRSGTRSSSWHGEPTAHRQT